MESALLTLLNTILLLVIAFIGRKKLISIHLLVNSRLEAALEQLRLLEEELKRERHQ